MSELEDRINSILGDPSQMEQITKLAQTLMGGAESSADTKDSAFFNFDPAMIGRISRLMNDSAHEHDNEALLLAMKPYLSEKRRSKMDKAMKLAKLARIAQLAMQETGDESNA